MEINNHTNKILKTLRKKTSLSQKKLATALGRSQSYVSRVERGLKKLEKIELKEILNILGQKEEAYNRLIDTQNYLEELATKAENAEQEKQKEISFHILQQSEVLNIVSDYFRGKSIEKAWLFGSFARAEQHAKSDIDVLIQFQKNYKATLIDLIQIKHQLEERTGYSVDVVENGSEYEYIRADIHQEKIPVYG